MTKRKYKRYLNNRLEEINKLYIDSHMKEDKYFYEGMIEGLEHVLATLQTSSRGTGMWSLLNLSLATTQPDHVEKLVPFGVRPDPDPGESF